MPLGTYPLGLRGIFAAAKEVGSHFTDVKLWVREVTWPAQEVTLVQEKASDLNPGLSEFQSSSLCPSLPQVQKDLKAP